MESKFWSLKGGPHLSATALSLARCASSSWPSPPQTSPRFRLRRKLRWPRWLGERDVLVDGAVRRLEAADWGASVKEATAATDRRISCFLAKMVRSTVSTQTASHCLTAFHLAHLPLSKNKILLIFQLPIRTNPCCALKITVQCIRMIFSPLQFGRL